MDEQHDDKDDCVQHPPDHVFPNWHWKANKWLDAIQKVKFTKMLPASLWPVPILEDEQETEDETREESEDEGECELYYY